MQTKWMVAVQILVLVLVLSGDVFAAEGEAPVDPKVVKNFKVRWSSVSYNKAVSTSNPEASQNPDHKMETLSLSCQAEVLDASLVLGTSQRAVITQMTDSKGREIAVGGPQTPASSEYMALRYDRKFQQPGPPAKWRAVLDTILQRPPQRFGPPQMITELQPCQIMTQLDMALMDQAGGELQTVKGYFHVLVPGSTETVEVPFEPNNAWVRLTPDLEIQVEEAICGNSFYRYKINTSSRAAPRMHSLRVGEGIPERFVIAQKFIGEDGKPMERFGGPAWLPAPVGGSGSASGGVGRVKAIRFVIAVNAKECQVPFELHRVRLPKP